MASPLRLGFAIVLLLGWCAPARAAVIAQADSGQSPVLEYSMALGATLLVLLVVCWPARKE